MTLTLVVSVLAISLLKESYSRVLVSPDVLFADLQKPEYLKEFVKVHITRRDFQPNDVDGDSSPIENIDRDNYAYDVHLNFLDDVRKLKLRNPDESIFAPNFKFQEVGVDESGNLVFKDVTPSREQITDLERTIFMDKEAEAVMHIHDSDGNYHLDGYAKGGRIKRAIENGDNDHVIISNPPVNTTMGNRENDVVDLNRPIVMGRAATEGKVTVATAEVGFVVDFGISKKFEFDNDKIMSYLAIMLNSVNIRYSLMDDPKITFKFTGIYAIQTKEAQPFIETANNGKKYTIRKILEKLAAWAGDHTKEIPSHDILPLLTSVESDSLATGISYLRGACWKTNKDQLSAFNTVAVVIDDGVTFSGSYTLAHELAHSMGTPHDGTDASKDCPWADGHLMSYQGWGKPNKFHFSECSKKNMKLFIDSSGGTCLREAGSETYVNPVQEHVGDVLSPNKQCQIETNSPHAFATDENSANEFCRRVVCKIPMAGSFKIMSKNRPPGFNTPCGVGGTCAHGICINNKEDPSERLDMQKMCVRKTKEPTAKLVIADSGDQQCQHHNCSVKSHTGSVSSYPFEVPDDGSFPCGTGGTCKNKKCVGDQANPKEALDLNKACVRRTGNPQAQLYSGILPTEECKVLKCQVPSPEGVLIAMYPDFRIAENSFPCGDGGKCVKGACVGESADKFDLNKVCAKKIGGKGAKFSVDRPETEQCKRLSCTYTKVEDTFARHYAFAPPDGSFPCGAHKGVCRGGECMPK